MSDLTPNSQDLDADIAAIRNILGTSADVPPEPAGAQRYPAFAPLAEDGNDATQPPEPQVEVVEPNMAAVVAKTVKSSKSGKAPKTPKPPKAPRRPILTRLPFVANGIARLRAYRPTLKHIAWVSMALLIVLRPGWVILPVVLSLFAILGCFVVFGADEVWDRVVRLLNWYSGKRPEKGRALIRKLDAFALRWDAILDRFPEGTVEALYMPDLNAALDRDAAHSVAMDARLSALKNG